MDLPITSAAREYTHPDYLDRSARLEATGDVRLDLCTVADERALADIRPHLTRLLTRLADDPSPLVPYPMSDKYLQARLGRLVLDTFAGEEIPEERIFFAAGTYPLWKELAGFLLERGTLLGAAPLYPEFPGWWRALGGRYTGVVAPDWSFPLPQLQQAIVEDDQVVAVLADCPGNASGMCPTRKELESLLATAAERNVLVVADEAYANFFAPRESCIDLCAKWDNLIVIRSLSKSWDLRGIRFGFAVYPKALAAIVKEVHTPFEPGTFAVAAAEYVLTEAPDFTAPLRRGIVAAKAEVMACLEGHGIKVLPTVPEVPNLIMTRPDFDLFGFFLDRKVKVASGIRFRSTTPDLDDRYCRIRVPLHRERIDALDALLAECPK